MTKCMYCGDGAKDQMVRRDEFVDHDGGCGWFDECPTCKAVVSVIWLPPTKGKGATARQ